MSQQISKASESRKLNDALHDKMCALVKKQEDEKRPLKPEETQEWDRMDAEYETRIAEIVRYETLEKHEIESARLDERHAGRELPESGNGDGNDERELKRESDRKVLRAFISQPDSKWDAETRGLIQENQQGVPPEAAAMGSGFVLQGRRDLARMEKRVLTAAAHETVAEEFMREMDVAALDFSGIDQAVRMINTATGADMPWPTADDTANSGRLLAEAAAAADLDSAFAAIVFQAFLYTSDFAKVPNQLLQDSAFNLESELARMLGIRLGRIRNTHGTTGTGSAQPRGIVTAVLADTAPVIAASATAIAYEDLIDLQHAVDPAYRPRGAWMMHDSIVKILKKLLDLDGRPLWSSGIAVREPQTILGHRFFINQAMDSAVVEDAESILFGDMSKYIIRRVINPVLVRLNERFAELYQTAFIMFDRWDSDLVDSGTGPIKILSHNLV